MGLDAVGVIAEEHAVVCFGVRIRSGRLAAENRAVDKVAAERKRVVAAVELAFGEDAVYGIGIGERGTSLPTKDIVDAAADKRSAIAGAGIPVAAAVVSEDTADPMYVPCVQSND